MSLSFGASLALVALLVVVIGAIAFLIARRRESAANRANENIPLFFPPSESVVPIARPVRVGDDWRAGSRTPPHTSSHSPSAGEPLVDAARDATWAPPPRRTPGVNGRVTPPRASERQEGGEAIEGHGVRYFRPGDGTLQFLPGRLEIVDGRDDGQEIRFVRSFGPDGTQVTFGRSEGAPYRHIQLREATVSRNHARMVLENGAWRLINLSHTNPDVVNGAPLSPDEATLLADGDRIEMGEVIFRFRER